MKVSKDKIREIASELKVVAEGHDLSTDQEIAVPVLWDLWLRVHGHRTWGDDHPLFQKHSRLLASNYDHELYPENTNDATMSTALRAAWKLVMSMSKVETSLPNGYVGADERIVGVSAREQRDEADVRLREAAWKELEDALFKNGIESAHLDDVVIDVATQTASRINNQGLPEQLEYLREQGCSIKDVLKELGLPEQAVEMSAPSP